jgi:hypothetical protein
MIWASRPRTREAIWLMLSAFWAGTAVRPEMLVKGLALKIKEVISF